VVKFSEDEQAALWELFEAGFPIRRSATRWGEGIPRSASTSCMRAEEGRSFGSALNCGFRWRNERRSRGGWRRDAHCARSPLASSDRRRRCAGK
jgi:hypothetical protein